MRYVPYAFVYPLKSAVKRSTFDRFAIYPEDHECQLRQAGTLGLSEVQKATNLERNLPIFGLVRILSRLLSLQLA